MVIKGTSKIRGVLDLNSIKRQIKSNDTMPISDNDYWNSDVQVALKMGYITAVGDEKAPTSEHGEPDRIVKLTNKLRTPLNIPSQTHAVPAGAQFTMRESELRDPDVRLAVSKGLIQVLSVLDEEKPSEGVLNLQGDTTQETLSPDNAKKEEEKEFQHKTEDNLTPAQRAFLNAQKKVQKDQPDLDTNEELPEPKTTKNSSNIIDTETPDEVKSNQVPDSLGKSVVFNPTGQKPINVIKNAHVANPKEGPSFVDQEQEKERVDKHPKLNQQEANNKGDIDMIDLEDVGTRRNPNLASKKSDEGEMIE